MSTATPILTDVLSAAPAPRQAPLRRAEPSACPVATSIAARRATQGDYVAYAGNAMSLRNLIRSQLAEDAGLAPTQRIALDAIAGALAHITTGRHDDASPWHEIAVSAQLVAEGLAQGGGA